MREKRPEKVFRSAAEWRAIVARYKRSGLTQATFCRQEGLALHTFKKHYRHHKEAAPRPGQFFEVVSSVPARKAGRSKWSCPTADACGCEGKAMWSGSGVQRILVYSEPVDMRKAFDGLLGLVKGVLAEDPLSGSLFVFVNRRKTYLKALYWDRTGFCLFAKRLERWRFRFSYEGLKQELSAQVFQLLLEGIELGRRRAG